MLNSTVVAAFEVMSHVPEAARDSLIDEITQAGQGTERLSPDLTRRILTDYEEHPTESGGLLEALVDLCWVTSRMTRIISVGFQSLLHRHRPLVYSRGRQ